MTALGTDRIDQWLEHFEKYGQLGENSNDGATNAYATLLLAREVAKLRHALVDELYELRIRMPSD